MIRRLTACVLAILAGLGGWVLISAIGSAGAVAVAADNRDQPTGRVVLVDDDIEDVLEDWAEEIEEWGEEARERFDEAREEARERQPPVTPTDIAGPPEQRGWLGLQIGPVPRELARRHELRNGNGVLVVGVVTGSPAEQAGVRSNDVLVQLDGQTIYSLSQMRRLIASLAPGRQVEVQFIRNGDRKSLQVRLGSAPAPATQPGERIEIPMAARRQLLRQLEPLRNEMAPRTWQRLERIILAPPLRLGQGPAAMVIQLQSPNYRVTWERDEAGGPPRVSVFSRQSEKFIFRDVPANRLREHVDSLDEEARKLIRQLHAAARDRPTGDDDNRY